MGQSEDSRQSTFGYIGITVESSYQAHIRYLAHTAYQTHAVFLTKSVQTLDKKRTALIRRKFGVGEAKLQVEQACEGSANEDHFCK